MRTPESLASHGRFREMSAVVKVMGRLGASADACRAAIECDARDNVVRVIDDFVEKQNVQWWTLRDLEEVLANGGFVNANFFRAYFLPVLWRAVQELRPYDYDGGACDDGPPGGNDDDVCAPCEAAAEDGGVADEAAK